MIDPLDDAPAHQTAHSIRKVEDHFRILGLIYVHSHGFVHVLRFSSSGRPAQSEEASSATENGSAPAPL